MPGAPAPVLQMMHMSDRVGIRELRQNLSVYLYPSRDTDDDARALSWVRASHAALDLPLWRAVGDWLGSDWPFGSVEYAPRS